MRILFISKNGLGVNIAKLMHESGHEIKLYIKQKKSKQIFDFIVPKINNWRKELSWVKKDGLIVFDDCGLGKTQDTLRKKGYKVFGGSEIIDKLEYDREYSQEILNQSGMNVFPLKSFKNVIDAAEYAKDNPDFWVIKRNGDNHKFISYVGEKEDGKDVLDLLKNYSLIKKINKESLTLQKKVSGVEIAVGRFFNGKDWVGPMCINIEHPHLFSGNIGPYTSEMGTLAWYTDEENKLYKETLGKLKKYLIEVKYRGDIDINCIVNEHGIFVLEATPRLGSPIVHLQSEIHDSGWAELMLSIASEKQFDLQYKKGYGIVFLIAVPPFPFNGVFKTEMCNGLSIDLSKCNKEELKHIHFEEVSKRIIGGKEDYYISDHEGYILYVTSHAPTIKEAREKALNIIKKIHVPKMFYRNDIGLKFENEDFQKLKDWGII